MIDLTLAETFLSDHFDSYTKKTEPSRRTLCGHGDVDAGDDSNFGSSAYEPLGAVQGKVTDSRMTKDMSFLARMGHPCGTNFNAAKFISEHPDYRWMSPILRDMNAGPWTPFKTGEQDPQAPNPPAGLTVTP